MDQILREQYPHAVEVPVRDGLKFDEIRKAIDEWCLDNIYEYDVSLLYRQRTVIGYVIRCSNMDDWMLAKLRWV